MSSDIVKLREPVNDMARWLVEIARKWQEAWRRDRVFEADPDPAKPKFFVTAAFPYPNSPLHLGHSRTYTITDVYARFMRMRGYNVLFPMGFHYTGTPILTMAEAIANGDPELIDLMLNIYDVPKEDLDKLKDPLGLARYFHEDAKKAMQEMGYSIDWRREFTTIDPEFKKFIIWQYTRLRELGYITRGSHPVGWCPVHHMPVGMHDTKGDVEPEIGEFTLILFEGDGFYMPAATLRPETVFGVTNLWVRPDATYVKARIDGRVYLVSERAAFKLGFQRDRVEVLERLRGEQLVGMWVVNPATGRRVPVLPADFVDPDTATGVVMSVPAHAPYDYVALRELVEERRELLEKLGIDPAVLRPIPLIKVEGYSEIPARDIVERLGVKSQLDREKLDEATKQLYSDEYHRGVVREDVVDLVYPDAPPDTRKFIVAPVAAWIAGAGVAEAREATAKWLSALGYADKMYEIMNRPVYCRCGNEIVVKVLKDQWFINYGDPGWKKLAYELLESMRIVPPEMREEFRKTIDWLHERAVARTRGLGTELPWAKGWIIESLSDSTIYMAFYTVVHRIRRLGIDPEKLTVEFWDYVLLGRGSPEEVAGKTGIPVEEVKGMREEFDYWYPLDSRHSGRDLVPNHLTFFIFHHAALFPREKWPRQIVVNGFVMLEGKKMSKSLRNIIPLRRALRVYGPDTVRATILASAELLQDANFSDALARSVLAQFSRLLRYVDAAVKADEEETIADRWLRSRLQLHIEAVTRAFEELRTRAATVRLLYEMENDAARYLSIRGSPGPALREYVEKWVTMLAPVAPHLAEEAWRRLGKSGYVSLEAWPGAGRRDLAGELAVEYVERLIEDVKSVLRVVKGEPRRLVIAVARPERWGEAQLVAGVVKRRGQLREAIRLLIERGVPGKRAAELAKRLSDYLMGQGEYFIDLVAGVESFDERRAIEELKEYIKARTGLEVEVYYEDEAPEAARRKKVLPGRPAIVLE
ncbi:MAG: leucine--tRNA ligase [Crenarchaeota archaeon]|nr:leucine--tRNA ligase [Thermoproteota archaeon]